MVKSKILENIKAQKAALYVRVSTEFQKDKDSIPLQIKDLEAMASFMGIEETAVFNDAGFSGKNTDRPKFQEMMERCRNGEFSHVLIWKLDRISRNLVDFCTLSEELKALNITLISKHENFDTSSIMGEAIMKIIMIFAEIERKNIVLRVTEVMKNRAREGIWNGGPPPFGYMRPPKQYDEDGKEIKPEHPPFPVPDPDEAPIVRLMFETYARLKSGHKTARYLNDHGLTSREGAILSAEHVIRTISKEFYIGNYQYNRTTGLDTPNPKEEWITVQNTHEPIISKELFYECERIRKGNRSFKRTEGQASALQDKHIFAGYAYCARCSYAIRASRPARVKALTDEQIYSRYNCMQRYVPNHGCTASKSASELVVLPFVLRLISRIIRACSMQFNNSDELEQFITDGKYHIVEINDILRAVRTRAQNYIATDDKLHTSNEFLIKELKDKITVKSRALNRLESVYLYAESPMSEDEYISKRMEITDGIARLEQEIENLKHPGQNLDDESFIAKAQQLVFLKKLQEADEDFQYYPLVRLAGKKVIREFLKSIITRIEFDEHDVRRIYFKNGLVISIS